MFVWLLWSLITVVTLVYFYARRKYSYWSERGVPSAPAYFPLGSMYLRLLHPPDKAELDIIRRYGKVQGTYQGVAPRLLVTDTSLLRQILVADFHVFVNRMHQNSMHQIWRENLFTLPDEKWKKVRSIVSPTFTSGKLKGMSSMMGACIEKLDQYLTKVTNDGQAIVIDTKEIISGLTVDIIAITTFATETNANNCDDRGNIFVQRAMNLLKFNIPRLFALLLLPKPIIRAVGLGHAFNQESFEFFEKLSRQIVHKRKESGDESRKDLVQLMLNASIREEDGQTTGYEQLTATMDEKPSTTTTAAEVSPGRGKLRKLTENELIAQCILFFMAGFETTASTLTFLIYELAHNQRTQARLADELNAALADVEPNSNEFYERVLAGIPYLDGAIKETLRKYPPVARLTRMCSKEGYQLGGVTLAKDLVVEISVYGIHYDPENYPDPERWRPERFLPENKHLLKPFTYLPFGDGPRNCVGLRFAYQEMKLALAYILPRYRFSPAPGTHYPVQFKRGLALFTPTCTDVRVERAARRS